MISICGEWRLRLYIKVFLSFCVLAGIVTSAAIENIQITVTSGENANFTCLSRTGSVLFYHVSLTRCYKPTFGMTLEVQDVTYHFIGNLLCFDESLSTNCSETPSVISTAWRVEVNYPPTITRQRIGDLEGTSLPVVTCPLTGYPWPSYTWGKLTNLSDFSDGCERCEPNDITVDLPRNCKDHDHYFLEPADSINGNRRAVGIPGRQTTSGCYFCRAKNKYGEKMYKFMVDLSGLMYIRRCSKAINLINAMIHQSQVITVREGEDTVFSVIFNTSAFFSANLLRNGVRFIFKDPSKYVLVTEIADEANGICENSVTFTIHRTSMQNGGPYELVLNTLHGVFKRLSFHVVVTAGLNCSNGQLKCVNRGLCRNDHSRSLCVCPNSTRGSRCEYECAAYIDNTTLLVNQSCGVQHVFYCDTHSNGIPPSHYRNISWQKGGQHLNIVGNSLWILWSEAHPDSTGIYSCVYGNRNISLFSISVFSGPYIIQSEITRSIVDIIADSGKYSLAHSCPVPVNILPTLALRWERLINGSDQCRNICNSTYLDCSGSKSARNCVQYGASLTSRDFWVKRTVGCSGCYRCHAENRFGAISADVPIHVRRKCPAGPFGQIDPGQPYDIYVVNATLNADSQLHVSAKEGAAFTLLIHVRDCPDNTTFHVIVPDDATPTDTVEHHADSCLYILRFTFLEIQKNDSGRYSCLMSSPGLDPGQNYTCEGVYLRIEPAKGSSSSNELTLILSTSIPGGVFLVIALIFLLKRKDWSCKSKSRRIYSPSPTQPQPSEGLPDHIRKCKLDDKVRILIAKEFPMQWREIAQRLPGAPTALGHTSPAFSGGDLDRLEQRKSRQGTKILKHVLYDWTQQRKETFVGDLFDVLKDAHVPSDRLNQVQEKLQQMFPTA